MKIPRINIVSNNNDASVLFPDEDAFILIDWERESKIFEFEEFGQIILIQKKDGSLEINSEHMSKEFVKEVLNKLVDIATFKD